MTWQVGRCPGDPSMVEFFVVNYVGRYIRSTTHQSILWAKGPKREQKAKIHAFFFIPLESLGCFFGGNLPTWPPSPPMADVG